MEIDALPFFLNGCPRRDERQNIAGLDALRKGEEFNEEAEDSLFAEMLVIWGRPGSLGCCPQNTDMGSTIKGEKGVFVRGNS
jgi:hypothetical protein